MLNKYEQELCSDYQSLKNKLQKEHTKAMKKQLNHLEFLANNGYNPKLRNNFYNK